MTASRQLLTAFHGAPGERGKIQPVSCSRLSGSFILVYISALCSFLEINMLRAAFWGQKRPPAALPFRSMHSPEALEALISITQTFQVLHSVSMQYLGCKREVLSTAVLLLLLHCRFHHRMASWCCSWPCTTLKMLQHWLVYQWSAHNASSWPYSTASPACQRMWPMS